MNHPLKNKLGDKSILIVDDQFYTVGDYRIRLEDVEVASEHVETLDVALSRIEQNLAKYGLILLDLNMPAAKSPQLQLCANRLDLQPTSRNHGRSLGLYLWDKRATLKLPYCYLSALPHGYGLALDEFAKKEAQFILDKASLLPSQLPNELVRVLADWSALPSPAASGNSGRQP